MIDHDAVVYESVRCVNCGVAGRGRPGFLNWKCLNCRPAKAAEPTSVADLFTVPAVSPHQGSPYRCREHHDVPVDRNGRGCPECPRPRR